MPANIELVQIAIRHQVLLEHLKSGQVQDFNAVFNDVDEALLRAIRSRVTGDFSDLTRKALDSLITDLTDIQSSLLSAKIDTFLKGSTDIASYEAEHEAAAIQSLSAVPLGLAVPAVGAIKSALKTRPIQATGDKLNQFFQGLNDDSVRRINNAVRLGYERGSSVAEIVNQLFGTASMGYVDGLSAMSRRQAATVVRTAVQQFSTTARELVYEENADVVVGYIWVSTIDSRTSSICRALDGRHFKTGQGPLPPAHPNCRSTTVPDLGPDFEFLNKGATRSSIQGYIPADMTYYDWLKTQSPEFQDATLGPKRGQLFREGGLSATRFAELQLSSNFTPITLEEMKRLEPLAFQRAGL